ncbi:MAG: zf-HC2 domain-containing protein [Clostridium sp.]|uniref:zf-HC2 domain-containing protein n=1 Tax=Clostridium sp. TaxID=1506 RepID=UPI0032169BE3
MLKCYIVKDLLPSYIDELLSKETTEEVELHLKECDNCQLDYEKMKSPVKASLPSTTDKEVDFLKKVRRKAWGTSIFIFAVGVFIGVFGIYIGETDDAPGAALIGIFFMLCLVVLGVKVAWRRR